MLEIVCKFIAALFQSVSIFFVMKFILADKNKYFNFKTVVLIILQITSMMILYNSQYTLHITIIAYHINIIIYKLILDISLSKAIIVSGITMMLIFVSDTVISGTVIIFSSLDVMRNDPLFFLICNISVNILSVNIMYIMPLRRSLQKFVFKLSDANKYDINIFIVLIVIVLSVILYNISITYKFIDEYSINILIMTIFIVLTAIFFKEKYDKESLTIKYDQLLDYVKDIEDFIEMDSLIEHESKNQLATIRSMIGNNKNIIEYIDSIIYDSENQKRKFISEISRVPKGGLKGLIYYKLSIATNLGIDINVNISKEIEKFIKMLKTEDIKNICRILGIYLDNSIDAVRDLDSKQISIEMYMLKDELNIVISNNYVGNINLKMLNAKGYSTKGKGRGNGLYYAEKIARKNRNILLSRTIVNDYFIERVRISQL